MSYAPSASRSIMIALSQAATTYGRALRLDDRSVRISYKLALARYHNDDLDGTLDRCRAAGVRLIDETPRIGAEGKRIAFLHPSATAGVLVELTEL